MQGSHILLNIRRLGVPSGYSVATTSRADPESDTTRPAADILTTIIDPQCYPDTVEDDASPTVSVPTPAESSTSTSASAVSKANSGVMTLPTLRIGSSLPV